MTGRLHCQKYVWDFEWKFHQLWEWRYHLSTDIFHEVYSSKFVSLKKKTNCNNIVSHDNKTIFGRIHLKSWKPLKSWLHWGNEAQLHLSHFIHMVLVSLPYTLFWGLFIYCIFMENILLSPIPPGPQILPNLCWCPVAFSQHVSPCSMSSSSALP